MIPIKILQLGICEIWRCSCDECPSGSLVGILRLSPGRDVAGADESSSKHSSSSQMKSHVRFTCFRAWLAVCHIGFLSVARGQLRKGQSEWDSSTSDNWSPSYPYNTGESRRQVF